MIQVQNYEPDVATAAGTCEGSTSMTGRHSRRVFVAQCARVAAGAATVAAFGGGFQAAVAPSVANAHNVSGNKARANELYMAMQSNYYLGATAGSLYNETYPRARSNPYAYL
jgi:hypothetical protein